MERPFLCGICRARFANKGALSNHKKWKHPFQRLKDSVRKLSPSHVFYKFFNPTKPTQTAQTTPSRTVGFLSIVFRFEYAMRSHPHYPHHPNPPRNENGPLPTSFYRPARCHLTPRSGALSTDWSSLSILWPVIVTVSFHITHISYYI